jgi:hypothetical protein
MNGEGRRKTLKKMPEKNEYSFLNCTENWLM